MSNGQAEASSGGGLVQSVDRAVQIMEILAQRGEAGVTEVAQELGVHKSTAFRLLGVLVGRDLVEQAGERGKYRLGVGLLRLAGATSARLDLTTQSRPICAALAAELGETTNVAVASDGVAINICEAHGDATVAAQNWAGRSTPLHATSSGKVLLAYMDPDERKAALNGELAEFTDHTVTSVRGLENELLTIREAGVGTALEELEIGLNAVAAPIRSHDGRLLAALSASGPAYRLGRDRFPEVSRLVIRAANEVSRQMGYLGERDE